MCDFDRYDDTELLGGAGRPPASAAGDVPLDDCLFVRGYVLPWDDAAPRYNVLSFDAPAREGETGLWTAPLSEAV